MIRKRDSRSLCQARKTRNKAFRKRNYFSCSTGNAEFTSCLPIEDEEENEEENEDWKLVLK